MVKEIEAAVGANDLTRVRRSCQNLKGTGNGYGYVTLTQAAQDALTALDSSQSVAESETEIRLLASLCTRLKPARAK